MKRICGIYKIVNLINGKVYIGQSVNIYKRWYDEKRGKSVNAYLRNAFNKYGLENFAFEILEECDISKLNEREIFYISFYRSNEHDFGYNLTTGGGNGRILNEESKKKMSEKAKGRKFSEETLNKISENAKKHWQSEEYKKRVSKKISESVKGRIITEEQKRKISETLKGHIPVNRKPVKCIETNIIYNSIANAAQELKIANTLISKCCNGKGKTAGGFHFQFV